MTGWSVVLIGSASGAVVGALAGLLMGWLGFRWQRRMWIADASQRMLERRDDRLQAVLTSVLKYGELLEHATEAGRLNDADGMKARFDEAQAILPDLEVSVRLDRMTVRLGSGHLPHHQSV